MDGPRQLIRSAYYDFGIMKLVPSFSKIILLTVPRLYFFVDHLCNLCLVFVMLSHLFIAALWSPAWKGLTSWLLFVRLNCVFSSPEPKAHG